MAKTEDYAWAAGFHEGEGNVHVRKSGGMTASISQTNVEPLMKMKELFGGSIYGPKDIKGGNKPVWVWTLNNVDSVRHYVVSIFPWLSESRGADALNKVDYWQTRYELRTRFCKMDHYKPSKGSCRACDLINKKRKYNNE